MAGRDITIPFGPDRTGGIDLSSALPEVDPNISLEASGSEGAALPDVAFEAASEQVYADAPVEDFAPNEEVAGEPKVGPADYSEPAVEAEPVDFAEDMAMDGEGDEPKENAPDGRLDVSASLAALRESINQGRELKVRQKERDEFEQKLNEDREELDDREDILANYFAIVAEQDEIIDQSTEQREARKNELAQLVAQKEETEASLQSMRDYHDAQMKPLETSLGRVKAAAEQAKNDERSRKSELNAAESEMRRAEGGDDAAMLAARLEVVQQAYDEAVARSAQAKEDLGRAQKKYDDLREQVADAEAPLERSIEDLDSQIEELKESVNRLGETISAARKRRQYCENVYQYPDETAKLRASVEADEETVHRMDEENEELRDRLADSKARSRTAKLAIAAVIAIIIIIIVAFVVIGGR